MNRMITCINCPVGCRLTAEISEGGEMLSVTGNSCPRGAKYAAQECTRPARMLTAVIPVEGTSVPLSVKTSVPVPKNLIPDVMRILGELSVSPPVNMGDVVVADIFGTGADIVATRSVSG